MLNTKRFLLAVLVATFCSNSFADDNCDVPQFQFTIAAGESDQWVPAIDPADKSECYMAYVQDGNVTQYVTCEAHARLSNTAAHLADRAEE